MFFQEFIPDIVDFGLISWKRSYSNSCLSLSEEHCEKIVKNIVISWSFKKSSPLNSLALCADALCLMGLAHRPHPTAAALVPPASLSAGPTGCLAELERQHLPLWNYHTLSSGCQSQFESRSDLSADWEISNWRLCLTRSNSVQQLQSGYTFK